MPTKNTMLAIFNEKLFSLKRREYVEFDGTTFQRTLAAQANQISGGFLLSSPRFRYRMTRFFWPPLLVTLSFSHSSELDKVGKKESNCRKEKTTAAS